SARDVAVQARRRVVGVTIDDDTANDAAANKSRCSGSRDLRRRAKRLAEVGHADRHVRGPQCVKAFALALGEPTGAHRPTMTRHRPPCARYRCVGAASRPVKLREPHLLDLRLYPRALPLSTELRGSVPAPPSAPTALLGRQ